MPRDLKADQEMLRTVATLAERRDFAQAASIAERVLSSGFEHPLLLNVLATQLELQGELEPALQLLERAVAMAPDDVGARNALALVLQRLDRPADALHHVDRLLRAHPELAFAHANRGNALIAMGRLDMARRSLLRALELDSDILAAEASLASIATLRGQHDEARIRSRKVLGRVPGFPDSILSLAAAELAAGSLDHAQMLVCQLLAEGRAGPGERARANGVLGDVLHAAGRYQEAFDAYEACNRALREQHRRLAQGAGILSYLEDVIGAMRRVEPPLWAQRTATVPPVTAASAHVFLVGFPCSGTSLAELVLAAHPRVACLADHELLTAGVLRFMREPVDFKPLLQADEVELQALRQLYWREVAEAGAVVEGKVFVHQHPLHSLKLPLIARLFPDAKILFAQRDPRDVVLDCFRQRFTLNPVTYELLALEGAASLYDAAMRLAELSIELLGLDRQLLRYESILAAPGRHAPAMLEFLGLEWAPELEAAVNGIAGAETGQWRHYRQALEPILPKLDPWVQRLGYDA